MTTEQAKAFLREHGICTCCHQYRYACVAVPDDYGTHNHYWRTMNVTSARPWWTVVELARILQRAQE